MGRTLSSDRRGEEWRDKIEIVDPPCSQFNPQTDLNSNYQYAVEALSPVAESFDGRVDFTPPFGCPNPNPLQLGMTEAERTRPVRNDDPEGFARGNRR